MSARLMTAAEYDTILAALRLLQNHLDGTKGLTTMDSRDIESIMTNDGDHEPLTAEDIDDLCDNMQYGHIQTCQELT